MAKRLPSSLRELREQRGMSQADVAVLIDRSVPSVSRFESGKMRPSPETIVRLAQIFGLSATTMRNMVGGGKR